MHQTWLVSFGQFMANRDSKKNRTGQSDKSTFLYVSLISDLISVVIFSHRGQFDWRDLFYHNFFTIYTDTVI